MIKQLGIHFVSFTILSLTGFYLHKIILSQITINLPFSLKEVYTFYAGFSLLLCTSFLLLSRTEKFKDQLGFLYLVSVALKIILFCIIFREYIFTQDSFTEQESINLLIPMILMLVLEVFFISKLLKNTRPLKNLK